MRAARWSWAALRSTRRHRRCATKRSASRLSCSRPRRTTWSSAMAGCASGACPAAGSRSARWPRWPTPFATHTGRRPPRPRSAWSSRGRAPSWPRARSLGSRPSGTTPRRSPRSPAAAASIVEVDVATGDLRILRYVVQHDCGTVVNPMIVEGQIRGGVAQGIGGAFYERIVYDGSGQPLTTTFMDFLIPTSMEIPAIEIGHTETPSPLNPLGAKGIGEGGAIPGPAVIAEAIDDALATLGVRVREMPLDPPRLLALIESARRAR